MRSTTLSSEFFSIIRQGRSAGKMLLFAFSTVFFKESNQSLKVRINHTVFTLRKPNFSILSKGY